MVHCDKPRRENYPWHETEAKVLKHLRSDLGENSKAWKWLQRSVFWDSCDLKLATTEQVMADYGSAGKGQLVNDARLLRTMIWQSWIKIQADLLPPIQGNLRSFWYQVVKPFYRRHELLEHGRSPRSTGQGITDLINECLAEFVSRRIFEYGGAFDFAPSGDQFWQRGKDKPRVLLFFEKRGMIDLCQWAYKYVARISYMASRGQPSFVDLEKFSKLFGDGRVGTFVIGAFPDWDPWGWKIAEELDCKMRFLGERVLRDKNGEWVTFKVETYMLTSAKLFTEEDVASGDDLSTWPQRYQKMIAEWMAKGGGVNGRPIALSVDAIPRPKMKVQIERFVDYVNSDQMDSHYVRVKPLPVDDFRRTFHGFDFDTDRYRI
jgi:hypothetical protein